jgi:hypothetical protein
MRLSSLFIPQAAPIQGFDSHEARRCGMVRRGRMQKRRVTEKGVARFACDFSDAAGNAVYVGRFLHKATDAVAAFSFRNAR